MFDFFASQDINNDSLTKFAIKRIREHAFPLETEVVTRLAQICTRVEHLELSDVSYNDRKAETDMAKLFREIVRNNPPLTHVKLNSFSGTYFKRDDDESVGEIILESLVNSTITTIQELDMGGNRSWFQKNFRSDREGYIEMLNEIISKQVSSLRKLNLSRDSLSSRSNQMLFKTLVECGVCSTLEDVDLWNAANFESEESYQRFAEILATAPNLKRFRIEGQRDIEV